jgi:hypothetical protein
LAGFVISGVKPLGYASAMLVMYVCPLSSMNIVMNSISASVCVICMEDIKCMYNGEAISVSPWF